MFRQSVYGGVLASLCFSIVLQNDLQSAQAGELTAISSKLNRDSFLLSREVRTRFRGIRGQRILFNKAYEIHEVADNIQSMVVFNAPTTSMQRSLSDISFLVENFEHSIKAQRLPVLRDPVITPTGPNGYTFSGGNGYPQPNFQCDIFQCYGPPYRMVPEQAVRNIELILKDMKSSISQLQIHYGPKPRIAPKNRYFPQPGPPVPKTDSNLGIQPNPYRSQVPAHNRFLHGWKPARKTVPVLPPVPPKNQTKPLQNGPTILPPLPTNE